MTRKNIIPGIKETDKGYIINPLMVGLGYLFFGIIALVLLVLPVIVPPRFTSFFGLLFFVYMIIVVIYFIRKPINFIKSISQKGKDKYKFKYESKGILKQKELQIKK